jgi:hypothetical protein
MRAGAVVCGGTAAVGGLIIGFHVYTATAVFAALELGVPAAILGGSLGFVFGGIVAAITHSSQPGHR